MFETPPNPAQPSQHYACTFPCTQRTSGNVSSSGESTTGNRLPPPLGLRHIEHNRLAFEIFFQALVPPFPSQAAFLAAAKGNFVRVARGIVDAHQAVF